MIEFLQMGGYGYYVWGAYGLTMVVLLANVVAARHRRRQVLRSVKHDVDRSKQ